MPDARDFGSEAYQAPFLERWGPALGGLLLLGLLGGWLAIARPWVDKGRAQTRLEPDPPVRLSSAPDLRMLQSRWTRRIAIHGAAVYVTWIDDRTTPPSVMLASSTDGGRTFSEHLLEAPVKGREASDPSLAVDSSGSVYLLFAYRQSEGQYQDRAESPRLARSDDGGASWASITNVKSVYTRDMTGAVMALDGLNVIHVAGIGNVEGTPQVLVTASSDRGVSFRADVQASFASEGRRRDLALAVTTEGRGIVVWSDQRNSKGLPENGELYGAVSTDGLKFKGDIPLVAPILKPGRQTSPQVLLTDAGRVGVVFLEGIDSEQRETKVLRYASSLDYGQTWEEAQTLFEQELVRPDYPSLIAGIGQHWYLLCRATLTDYDQPTMALAQSRNEGARWGELTALVDRYSDKMTHPCLAVQENTLLATYFDFADPASKVGTQEAWAVRVVDASLDP